MVQTGWRWFQCTITVMSMLKRGAGFWCKCNIGGMLIVILLILIVSFGHQQH